MRSYLILLLLLSLFLTGCNSSFHIEKRKYNKGFYVSKTNKSNQNIIDKHYYLSNDTYQSEIKSKTVLDSNKTSVNHLNSSLNIKTTQPKSTVPIVQKNHTCGQSAAPLSPVIFIKSNRYSEQITSNYHVRKIKDIFSDTDDEVPTREELAKSKGTTALVLAIISLLLIPTIMVLAWEFSEAALLIVPAIILAIISIVLAEKAKKISNQVRISYWASVISIIILIPLFVLGILALSA